MSEGKSAMEQEKSVEKSLQDGSCSSSHPGSQDSDEKSCEHSSSSSSDVPVSPASEENAGSGAVKRKKEKKPRSEASVVLDKKTGVCTCKRCGWVYPNARPSAKHRREHRKHCGNFQTVHAWLDHEGEGGETGEVDEAGQGMLHDQSEDDDPSSSGKSVQEEKPAETHDENGEFDKNGEVQLQEEDNKVQSRELEHDKVESGDGQQVNKVQSSEVEPDQQDKSRDEEDKVQNRELEHEKLAENGDGHEFQQDNKVQRSRDEHEYEQENVREHVGDKVAEETVFRHEHHPTHSGKHYTNSSSEITAEKGTQSTEQKESSEHDLEKILREQTSHHLMCPNCGSCITRRVILKKRKRTGGITIQQVEKQAKTEQKEDVHREVPDEVEAERGSEEVEEAWGCLACFAIFFRKIRENLEEPVDPAHHFSCLPYLLPDFHWDGDGLQTTQEEEERPGSRCLPIEFPWMKSSETTSQEEASRDIEIVINLPDQTATAAAVATDEASEEAVIQDEQEQQKDRFSCLPLVIPTYWGVDEPAAAVVQEPDSAEVDENKAGLNCLPALTYTWRRRKSYEPQEVPEPDEPQQVSEPEEVEQKDQDITSKADESIKAVQHGGILNLVETVRNYEQIFPGREQKDEASTKADESIKDVQHGGILNFVETVRNYEQIFPGREQKDEASADETSQEVERKEPVPAEDVEIEEKAKDDGSLKMVETERNLTLILPKPEQVEKESCNCLPVSMPKYSWSQRVSPAAVQEEEQEDQTDAKMNCLPVLLPPFSWDGDEEYVKTQEVKKEDSVCLPLPSWKSDKITETDEDRTYVTKETRIQAWVKTITNVVTVRRKHKDAVKVDEETTFVDMKVSEKNDGVEKTSSAQTLVSNPSTGWAWLNALDKADGDAAATAALEKTGDEDEIEEEEGDDVKLEDKRKRQQRTEIEEIQAEQPTDLQKLKEDVPVELEPEREELSEEKTNELDVEALLTAIAEQKPPYAPSSTTVSVKSPDSVVQVTGGDPQQAVETALAIAEVLPDQTRQRQPDPVQEYVKSIVYGGLDVTLTSLAVVSSGAGAGTKTINVVAISLANLIAGLITLFHTIGSLYQTNRPSFEHYIGQSLWINGGLSVISFLVFGFVAPLTYALSFRSGDDRDYKFAATALASLACLSLMGLAKAHVERKRYVTTVVNLVMTGFVASVAGYFVGDYISRWLQKMGFDTDQPLSPPKPSPPWPPSPPLPLFGGRRGGASM